MAHEKFSIFQKRLHILSVIFFLLFLLLIGRLAHLQIYQSSKYEILSEGNRINLLLVLPPRGNLFDRNGQLIAANKQVFQATINLNQTKDFLTTLEQVASLLSLSSSQLDKIKSQIQNHPRHIPLSLKKNLSWEEVALLELNRLALPGVNVISATQRHYPWQEAIVHITGYVSAPTEEEVIEDASLNLPDAQSGKTGIERIHEEKLKGKYGRREIEVNARGSLIRTLSYEPPLPGQDLFLTIDVDLQKYMYEKLAPYKSATAVVMDIHTGAILAMVSVPGYNPNSLVTGLEPGEWQTLIKHDQAPLTNKAITGLYSPASILKLPVSLASFAHPDIGTSFQTYCNGHMKVGNHKFHCWKKHGHGAVDFRTAMQRSCDIYYYEAGKRMGHQAIYKMANKLGFGKKLGIDLPQEKAGLLPTPQWKRQRFKENWYLGDTILFSIGQGTILTTPLQWVTALAAITNGGYLVTPHVTQSTLPYPKEYLNIPPAHLNRLVGILDETTNKSGGTGYVSRITMKGFEMGGKTATGQVRHISLAERAAGIRRGDDLPWALRDNSMFIGFAPVHEPKYAIAVLVEHGGWGSQAAAPLGRDILLKTQQIMAAQPLEARYD